MQGMTTGLLHSIRSHSRCQLRIFDYPIHCGCGLQWNVVTSRHLNRSNIIGLKLLGHELLKLPIPMGKHVRSSSFENLLLSVVLRDCRVTFVDCDECVWAKVNDTRRKIDELLEFDCVAFPLV